MIVAADITLHGREQDVLAGCTFSIGDGRSLAIVGPAASGKTALVRCIAGLASFTGQLLVDGHDVVAAPLAARARVSIVPQRPAFGRVRVREHLERVARLRGRPGWFVGDALDRAGLIGRAGSWAADLSPGLARRLSLAAVLVADPRVLVVDDAVSELDAQAHALLADLRADRSGIPRTVLLTAARGADVAGLTDDTLLLEDGRIRREAAVFDNVIPLQRRARR